MKPEVDRTPGRERAKTKSDRWTVAVADVPLALLLRGVFFVAGLLSERALLRLSHRLGSLFWRWVPRRRHIVQRNLDIAFGDQLSPEQKREIGHASAQHSTRVLTSLTLLSRWSRNPALPDRVVLSAQDEEVVAPVRDGGHAILTGHIGNWEVGRLYMSQRGIPLMAVARGLRHRRCGDVLFGAREHCGKIIAHDAPNELWRALRAKNNIAIIADQNNRRRAMFADFFGVPASSFVGYARLLLRARYRILFMACLAEPESWRWRMFVRELYSPASRPRGGGPADRRREAERLVSSYLKVIEELVREYPRQYVWAHRRWKSRPEGTPGLYDRLGEPLDPRVREATASLAGSPGDAAGAAF